MTWSTRKTLAEYAPKRGMDEFFRVGKDRAYGVSNQMTSPLGRYSTGSMRGNPRFDIVEYFGRTAFAEGDVVDKEKVDAAVIIPVSRREVVNKFYENNNPGSIKRGKFGGQTWGGETYEGSKTGIKYRKYDSPEEGLADIPNVIQDYETNDIQKIMKRYASDDKSGTVYKQYAKDIERAIGSDKIDFSNDEHVKNLMKAITIIENKTNSVPPNLYYKEEDFNKAVKIYQEIRIEGEVAPFKKKIENIKVNKDMKRLGFRYGGSPHGGDPAGTGTGGQGPAGGQSSGGNYGGGNTSGNVGSTRGSGNNTTSVRDSGMVSTSTGYGPLGAGGEALGPDGNQGGPQKSDKNKSLFDTEWGELSLMDFDYDPTLDKTIVNKTLDKFNSLKSFVTVDVDTDYGDLSISPDVDVDSEYAGVKATLSFEKGGLLDKKRFKKA